MQVLKCMRSNLFVSSPQMHLRKKLSGKENEDHGFRNLARHTCLTRGRGSVFGVNSTKLSTLQTLKSNAYAAS